MNDPSEQEQMLLKRYDHLKNEICHHDYLYYTLDKPEISDYEYDQLFNEFVALESQLIHQQLHFDQTDSPSQRVGGKPLDSFQKVAHRIPMLSLANSYAPEDLKDFDERIHHFLPKWEGPFEYYCEPKFDGLAIELIYTNGILTQAITRGDGTIGEDVTQNIRTIRNIPLKLKSSPFPFPSLLEVRGEILIFKKDFLQLNEQQLDQGLTNFANPRNAASGTVRQLDPKIASSRPLRFFAYSFGSIENSPQSISTQEELETLFIHWGIPVVDESFENTQLRKKCLGINQIIDFYHRIEQIRPQLKFEIDGIVAKINSFSLQKELGVIARNPRWATAAKYKPQQATTTVQNIIVQVGRTGALTPVAIMKPVQVGGVVVTNATLHNQEEISRKDIRINDTVIIQRAGDVIPEIVSVVLEKRDPKSQPFYLPSVCPNCNESVLKTNDEVVTRCINPFCSAILKESIKHFVSRKAMNVDKVGDKLVNSLVDAKLVSSFSDLYRLDKNLLLKLERKGEKSVHNILKSLESSKKTALHKFLFALGIRFVGEQTAKSLAKYYKYSLSSIMTATEEDLLQIPDIGPKVAHSIFSWLNNENMKIEVENLISLGITFTDSYRANKENSSLDRGNSKDSIIREMEKGGEDIKFDPKLETPLIDKTFLITGTLPISRDLAKEQIESYGGILLSSVSSKLNYLVVGESPGSKLKKAQQLGVTIISWEELLDMVLNK